MKSKDQQNWLKLLYKSSIPFDTFIDLQYINNEALEKGAVFTISIRGLVDLNFNKNGKLIGTNTYSINSFRNK